MCRQMYLELIILCINCSIWAHLHNFARWKSATLVPFGLLIYTRMPKTAVIHTIQNKLKRQGFPHYHRIFWSILSDFGHACCMSSRRQYVSIEKYRERAGLSLNPDSPHFPGLLVETTPHYYRSTAKWHHNFWSFENGCCDDVLLYTLSYIWLIAICNPVDCMQIVLDTLPSPQQTSTTNSESTTLWSFTQGCHKPFSTHIGVPLPQLFPVSHQIILDPLKSHDTLDQSI